MASTGAAPSRPAGKLSILPVPAAVATGDNSAPRTPRRESAKTVSGAGRSTKPLQQAKAPANEPSNQSSGADEASTAASTAPHPALPTTGSDAKTSNNNSRPPTNATRRWGVLRKGVVPNPALMKINDKVMQIIQTLRKPAEDRTEADVKLLYTWLMNQEKLSSLFTTMSEVSAKKLCKEMEFLHLASGEVVVNQGDKGNTCFILVSGVVSVYVRSAEEQKKYYRVSRASIDGGDAKRLMEQGLIAYGAKVATLTPGATFGELCLIEPDSKRSATVVVDPMAQIANFIVLTAASYLRMTRSQTIEGTITDHISFLQHTLLFKKWTKMQLMHLVNSMKLVTVPAGQYLTHKGGEADSFFMLLRGEAQECVKLMLNEHSEMSVGESRGVQHCVTVELTFLGKFDVAGEYLAAEKKVVVCPVDIRAVSDVDCLVLSRKLFNLHFAGKEIKPHAAKAVRKLRVIAAQRETWRETRIDQALRYPNLRVPITRKLMRLSGNCCMICGRDTHVAGDELCMELATYYMRDEKKKKQSQAKETRSMSRHRISIASPSQALAQAQAAAAKAQAKANLLPVLDEEGSGSESDDDSGTEESEEENGRRSGLGRRLLKRQWKQAAEAGLTRPPPRRPETTPRIGGGGGRGPRGPTRDLRITSITHTQHVSRRKLLLQQQEEQQGSGSGGGGIDAEIRRIRESWPYGWRDLEPVEDKESLPFFERLYRNSPRPSTSASPRKQPHTAR